ncbi:hypothetical protein RYX36_035646 [Vicia faba]
MKHERTEPSRSKTTTRNGGNTNGNHRGRRGRPKTAVEEEDRKRRPKRGFTISCGGPSVAARRLRATEVSCSELAVVRQLRRGAISETSQIHRFPQYKYIHAVCWLPVLSAFNRFAVLASSDSDSDVSSIEIHSFKPNPISFNLHSSWASPSPISSLKASQFLQKSVIAASTSSGSLHFLFADSNDRMLESEVSVPENELHSVGKSCIDLIDGGVECVTVGDDGKVNLVSVGDSNLNYRRLFDSDGLVSYTAVKWASPVEFATGGYGFGLQWWDKRKLGHPISQFKGNW